MEAAQDWTGLRTEALRLQFHDPAGAPRWRFYEAWALLQQGDAQQATPMFVALADQGPPELAPLASLAAARSWRGLDPRIALRRYESLAGAPEPVATQARLGAGWSYVAVGRFDDAAALALPSPALAAVLERPRWRRPGAAAALSAVIPGAGQFYAGAPREGAAALFVVGGLGAGTAILVERESWTGAAVVGTLFGSFWLGNLYGAADAAVRHNRRVREAAAREIEALELPVFPEVSDPGAPAPR